MTSTSGAPTRLVLVRKGVHSKYDNDRDIVRSKVDEKLKFHIRCMNKQGGLEVYKHALAQWQIFKTLCPEWITDADRPKLVPQCWKNAGQDGHG